LEQEELNFFELLISIPGIGPKSALAILSVVDPETLKKAVSSGDSSYLTKVSGIGKKNAEKIVLELKDKIGAIVGNADNKIMRDEMETLEALQALGYSIHHAREALKKVPEEIKGTNNRLKETLKLLGKN
jgi:holliday junction DNA helicase RuvA